MTLFLQFTVIGLVTGAIYAIAASGLVVTYTTSGIFNFAHGAIGMVMAFAFWELHVNHGWPTWISLVLVVFMLAPLVGALIERFLMRGLAGAPATTTMIVTVGLMVALIGIAETIWSPSVQRQMPPFFGSSGFTVFGFKVTAHELITMIVAVAVAVFLRLLLFRTRIGTAMRAVVDDRNLVSLNGARPGLISMLAWAMGSSLAAIAGILLAPQLQLSVLVLTLLVVNAYAAAMVGRLTSLPLTFAGAMVLGLLQSYASFVGIKIPGLSGLLAQIQPSLPTIIVFARTASSATA